MNQFYNKRKLKPWHGIILIILSAICIFVVSPWMSMKMGLYATPLYEGVLLLLSIGTVLVFGGDLRRVFPFRKPEAAKVFGTILFWMGCFGVTMIITLFITVLFPEQMVGTSQGLGSAFTSVPFLMSFLIISITPAICEEAVFRGVFLNSLHGSMSKWAVIIITSVIFGIFHGSIWRFVPTTILGIAMAYILYETGNMFYNMMFHAVNNLLPLILLYALNAFMNAPGMDQMMGEMSAEAVTLPAASAGLYLTFGGAAAFFIYIGNYLLHRGRPGYQNGLFPKEKRTALFILIGITVACVVIGILTMIVSLIAQQGMIQEMMDPYI